MSENASGIVAKARRWLSCFSETSTSKPEAQLFEASGLKTAPKPQEQRTSAANALDGTSGELRVAGAPLGLRHNPIDVSLTMPEPVSVIQGNPSQRTYLASWSGLPVHLHVLSFVKRPNSVPQLPGAKSSHAAVAAALDAPPPVQANMLTQPDMVAVATEVEAALVQLIAEPSPQVLPVLACAKVTCRSHISSPGDEQVTQRVVAEVHIVTPLVPGLVSLAQWMQDRWPQCEVGAEGAAAGAGTGNTAAAAPVAAAAAGGLTAAGVGGAVAPSSAAAAAMQQQQVARGQLAASPAAAERAGAAAASGAEGAPRPAQLPPGVAPAQLVLGASQPIAEGFRGSDGSGSVCPVTLRNQMALAGCLACWGGGDGSLSGPQLASNGVRGPVAAADHPARATAGVAGAAGTAGPAGQVVEAPGTSPLGRSQAAATAGAPAAGAATLPVTAAGTTVPRRLGSVTSSTVGRSPRFPPPPPPPPPHRFPRMPLPEALELLICLAEALRSLHRRGLTHGALTPKTIQLQLPAASVLAVVGAAAAGEQVAGAGREAAAAAAGPVGPSGLGGPCRGDPGSLAAPPEKCVLERSQQSVAVEQGKETVKEMGVEREEKVGKEQEAGKGTGSEEPADPRVEERQQQLQPPETAGTLGPQEGEGGGQQSAGGSQGPGCRPEKQGSELVKEAYTAADLLQCGAPSSTELLEGHSAGAAASATTAADSAVAPAPSDGPTAAPPGDPAAAAAAAARHSPSAPSPAAQDSPERRRGLGPEAAATTPASLASAPAGLPSPRGGDVEAGVAAVASGPAGALGWADALARWAQGAGGSDAPRAAAAAGGGCADTSPGIRDNAPAPGDIDVGSSDHPDDMMLGGPEGGEAGGAGERKGGGKEEGRANGNDQGAADGASRAHSDDALSSPFVSPSGRSPSPGMQVPTVGKDAEGDAAAPKGRKEAPSMRAPLSSNTAARGGGGAGTTTAASASAQGAAPLPPPVPAAPATSPERSPSKPATRRRYPQTPAGRSGIRALLPLPSVGPAVLQMQTWGRARPLGLPREHLLWCAPELLSTGGVTLGPPLLAPRGAAGSLGICGLGPLDQSLGCRGAARLRGGGGAGSHSHRQFGDGSYGGGSLGLSRWRRGGVPLLLPDPGATAAGSNGVSPSCDVYSLGLMMWYLMSGQSPLQHLSTPEQVQRVKELGGLDEQLPFCKELPLSYIQLARRCWSPLPMQRPSMHVVLAEMRALRSELAAAARGGEGGGLPHLIHNWDHHSSMGEMTADSRLSFTLSLALSSREVNDDYSLARPPLELAFGADGSGAPGENGTGGTGGSGAAGLAPVGATPPPPPPLTAALPPGLLSALTAPRNGGGGRRGSGGGGSGSGSGLIDDDDFTDTDRFTDQVDTEASGNTMQSSPTIGTHGHSGRLTNVAMAAAAAAARSFRTMRSGAGGSGPGFHVRPGSSIGPRIPSTAGGAAMAPGGPIATATASGAGASYTPRGLRAFNGTMFGGIDHGSGGPWGSGPSPLGCPPDPVSSSVSTSGKVAGGSSGRMTGLVATAASASLACLNVPCGNGSTAGSE